jgi:hypothetical protein
VAPKRHTGDQEKAWVEVQHGPWIAAYAITVDEGQPVVAELRVTPTARVPAGGLTARMLRELKPGAAVAEAYAEMGLDADRPPRRFAKARKQPTRPGRRGRDDSFYANIAWEYVRALTARSRHPVADTAEVLRKNDLHYSDAYVRDAIAEARRRGLLTPARRGRAGGRLTEKGRKLCFEQEKWWEE